MQTPSTTDLSNRASHGPKFNNKLDNKALVDVASIPLIILIVVIIWIILIIAIILIIPLK